jgi:VWFA-related protein
VKIDGKPARVDSVTWVGHSEDASRSSTLGSTQFSGAADPAGTGRLIVFVFQKDLLPIRVRGLMRMLLELKQFVDLLQPEDRVAVLSFDSHLKIWTDFTNDHERLGRLFERRVLLEDPTAVEPGSPVSLTTALSVDTARRTYTIEKGLLLIGNALRSLPGSKSIVLVGYGFGSRSLAGISMDRDYDAARRALVQARTAVLSIDVTEAASHSLEAGLQLISEATGGFYFRANVSSSQAMQHLVGALSGSYVLFVEKPESARTSHDLNVRLARGKGTVLARSGIEN